MSGSIQSGILTKTLKSLSQGEASDGEKEILKQFGMLKNDDSIKPEKKKELEKLISDFGDISVTIDSKGKLVRNVGVETVDVMKAGQAQSKLEKISETIAQRTTSPEKEREKTVKPIITRMGKPEKGQSSGSMVTAENIEAMLASSAFKMEIKILVEKMNEFAKTIPEDEKYNMGEVSIRLLKGAKVSVHNLVAAGTLVLDAVLYSSYHEDQAALYMFAIEELEEISMEEVSVSVDHARKAFIAALVLIYNRGSMPTYTSDESNQKPLIKLLRENLYHDELTTESEVAKYLSCTTTRKFPARSLLDVNIDGLPPQYVSRMKLAVAGNRVVKYAEHASLFAQSSSKIDANAKLSADELAAHQKIVKAHELVDALRSRSGNFHAQLKLHPLNPNKSVPVGFTMKMTSAILHSLTEAGRLALVKHFQDKDMRSFLKDKNIMGSYDALNNRTWPILNDENGNFMGLTKDTVNKCFDG
nr:TPA_asm: coat protein [Lepidozia ophiovirus_sela]